MARPGTLLKLVRSWSVGGERGFRHRRRRESRRRESLSKQIPSPDDWNRDQREVVDAVANGAPVVLCGTYPLVVTFVLDLLLKQAETSLTGLDGDDAWARMIMTIGEMSEWPVVVLTPRLD